MKLINKYRFNKRDRLPLCLIGVFVFLSHLQVLAQTSGSITVGGDIDTFYPVAWLDGNFHSNQNTHLSIGRSNVHTDASWRGAFIAEFTFHTHNWGHGANFIDAKLSTSTSSATVYKSFIGGWRDATSGNSDRIAVIWLRGGGTTYYYYANAAVNPKVHDGVQHGLPYVSSNGGITLTVKTAVDAYVDANANMYELPVHVYGSRANYFHGNVGIGKRNATDKLEVNGNIRAKEIKVETDNWPDYVFKGGYDLTSLKELEAYIKQHGHLPEIPKASEVEEEGVALGEMNRLLLKKVEELTLHLIEKDKTIDNILKRLHLLEHTEEK